MTLVLILAILLGFYVAWNIGANDVANAMGTSVGSGALTLFKAVILAAILEFCGAFFLGGHVSETVESGIIDPSVFAGDPNKYIYGMLSCLLAVGVWLQTASYFGWPVSTTHSIVGALVGFGAIYARIDAIYWGRVLWILTAWIASPLIGGSIAFVIFNIIRRHIFYQKQPVVAAKRLTPYFVFCIFLILLLMLLYQGFAPFHFNFFEALGIAAGASLLAALISAFLVRRIPTPPSYASAVPGLQFSSALERALRHLRRAENAAEADLRGQVSGVLKQVRDLSSSTEHHGSYEVLQTEYRTVERIFVFLQILSACFMAFAHGANDVANAIGPLSGVISMIQHGVVVFHDRVPLWILGLGGVGIVVGLATWGWRVIRTIGHRITDLTPTRGFAAEFAAAATIIVASRLGLPISTTHTLVGAVLGVGLARGIGAINMSTIRDIVISWVVTVPAGALLAIIFYKAITLVAQLAS